MSKLAGVDLRVVLYEGKGSAPLEPQQRLRIIEALLADGCSVSSVRNRQTFMAQPGEAVIVMGRFAGAAPSFCSGLGFFDLEGQDVEAAAHAAEEFRHQMRARQPGAWKPWFPVIDYSRCTNCMQCLSFCLFDVYGVSPDGKIQVRNQDNCKTDCPACSRVCPEVAIMFPKYRHAPINGDEVSADDLRREAMKVDISALLGGDIYGMLRDRSAKAKSRFSKERDEERALKERQNCLLKLQKDLQVPPEVLASLPTPDQIIARAEAAKAKAQEALSRAHAAEAD